MHCSSKVSLRSALTTHTVKLPCLGHPFPLVLTKKLSLSFQLNPFEPLTDFIIEEGILETKTDCSAKDLLFFACVVFCVITFEPIMIKTCSAPQNDRQNFSFVKDTCVDGEKLARNGQKTATY